jgi:hypothetical protein
MPWGNFPWLLVKGFAILVRTGAPLRRKMLRPANGRMLPIPPGKYGEIGFTNRNFLNGRNAGPWPASHCGRLKTKQALVPPNPKEFDMTNSTSRLRALCGTRSISVATDA